MDYFADVYLKKLNRFGDNIQSRVHGQMQHDFENKLKKSVNKVTLFNCNGRVITEGIIEPNKIEEQQVLNYLCTRVSDNFENGSIFYTQKPFLKDKQAWIILYKEQYETIGYNRYKIVLLENTLEWIGKDGLIHSAAVHYIGSMDSVLREQFKIDYEIAAASPSKTLSMICAYDESLVRDLRINISDETWRVRGYDKISIPGVMFVSLEEDFVQKTEFANEEELKKWSIISNQGLEIVTQDSTPITFYASYNGTLTEEKVMISCEDNIKVKCDKNNVFYFDGAPSTTKIIVALVNAPKVTQEFSLTISETNEDWLAIVGPQNIKVMQTLEYKLNTSLLDYNIEIDSEFGNFKITEIKDNMVYIQGINIGKDNIVIKYDNMEYKTPINIISPWM